MQKENNERMLFNYDAYKLLVDAINEKESGDPDLLLESHEMIEMGLKSCADYVERVDAMELAMPRLMATTSGAEYRDRVSSLDSARKIAHDAAIAQARIINRMCHMYGVTPVCLADLNDRIQVGDYCIDVTRTIFEKRAK